MSVRRKSTCSNNLSLVGQSPDGPKLLYGVTDKPKFMVTVALGLQVNLNIHIVSFKKA